MPKFKLTDKYIAFVNAVASGMPAYKAYQEHVSKGCTEQTAQVQSTRLMKRPEVQKALQKAQDTRLQVLNQETARAIAKEFKTSILTTEEIDAFHCAVLKGEVEVEEVVPVHTFTYDEKGKVAKRQTSFLKVKRPPNIREKQISAAELYRRRGAYPPTKLMGAFGKVNDETGDLEDVQRFVLLSNGERLPL